MFLSVAWDWDLTESLGPDENPVAKTPSVTGGKTATCPVESWRTPRTLCTLSWNDGTVGRGFITCREDSLTESQRQQSQRGLRLLKFHDVSYIRLYIYYI